MKGFQGERSATCRCLHYLPSVRLEEGGVTRAVLDLCGILARHDVRVTLLTADPTDVPQDWSRQDHQDGVPRVVSLPRPRRLSGLLPRAGLAIAQRLLRENDLLHLHAPWTTSNLQLRSLAVKADVPYLVTLHGMLDDWSMAQKALKKRLYLRVAGRRFLEGAARVHCTAQAELDQAGKWFPAGRPVVLPYIFDVSAFQTLPDPQVARTAFASVRWEDPTVLFLSRLHPKKGVEHLIAAASLLHRQRFRCSVIIAGPGSPAYRAQLEQLVRHLNLQAHVTFVGMVRGEEKLSLYRAADLFVLPTSQENFGLVLTESLACGTPVVTTRGVDIWQELEAAGAMIVDQSDGAVAGAVKTLLEQPEKLQDLGRRGREWIFRHLEPAKLGQAYRELYESVLAERPVAGTA